MQTKLPIAVLCGVLLMTLAACGGSGDGARITELETELAAEQEAREQAEELAADAELKRQEEETARLEAEAAEAEAAEAEAAEAEAAKEAAAEAEAALQAAEAAEQQAQQQLAQAQQESERLEQQLTEAEQAELRARASDFGEELDLGTTGVQAGDTLAEATVTWPRGGSLTFRPSGVTHTSGSAAPSVPGGWRSAGFTGQSGTVGRPSTLTDETVYLYTNIQAPGTRAFWKKYGGNDLTVTQTDVTNGLANPSTSVSRTRQIPGDSTTRYASATTGGTYDGVSGTFSCTGNENVCTVTRTDGTTAIGNTNWMFEATSLNSGAPVDEDDAFLYFGIWSSIPDDINGDEYNFRYVAGGGAQSGSDLGNFNTLIGPATFRGGAVGKYVTQGQVGGQNAKIGTFTATATLNANFGTGDTANDPGTLSGRITDFREGGGPLSGWRVTLGSSGNVSVASVIAGGAASGSTVANIGGLPVGGSWGATFHGSTNKITGLDDRTTHPGLDLAGVAGWFDATGSDASLAGAFAATPQ